MTWPVGDELSMLSFLCWPVSRDADHVYYRRIDDIRVNRLPRNLIKPSQPGATSDLNGQEPTNFTSVSLLHPGTVS
jgi:hypothetical protein